MENVCVHTHISENLIFHVDKTFSEIMYLVAFLSEACTFSLPKYLHLMKDLIIDF